MWDILRCFLYNSSLGLRLWNILILWVLWTDLVTLLWSSLLHLRKQDNVIRTTDNWWRIILFKTSLTQVVQQSLCTSFEPNNILNYIGYYLYPQEVRCNWGRIYTQGWCSTGWRLLFYVKNSCAYGHGMCTDVLTQVRVVTVSNARFLSLLLCYCVCICAGAYMCVWERETVQLKGKDRVWTNMTFLGFCE